MSDRKFPVLEMFVSIQGEGRFTGYPSLFVRLGGCNLRCVFGNSRCDTPYSSFELDKPICTTVKEAVAKAESLLMANPHVEHIVITGGEPMLYKDAIKEFLDGDLGGKVITIETNGTLPALMTWENSNECEVGVDLWSVSPKLSTSVDKNLKYLTPEMRDNHDRIRINIDNLASYYDSMKATQEEIAESATLQFKFVYSGPDSVTEIENILEQIAVKTNTRVEWLSEYVMLMPEGTTNDQLSAISQECAQVCINKGWTFCDRLHIRIWGDKRGV